MGSSAGLPIALGFILGVMPFGLWTWWMLRGEREAREAGVVIATPHRNVRRLPVSELPEQVAYVTAGSFCRVAGSIGFAPSGATLVCTDSARGARPRWRLFETIAA
jgi:hypothetical protein